MKLGPDFFNDNTQQIIDCLDGPEQECYPITPAETTRRKFQKAAEMYNTALRTYDGKNEDRIKNNE